MRPLKLLAIFALSVPSLVAQAEWPHPKWEKVHILTCRKDGTPVYYKVGKYRVELSPSADLQKREFFCRASLVSSIGEKLELMRDKEVCVYQGTGEDILGDGNQSLVLEGFSGGAHCCYTYKIFSLGQQSSSVGPIENQSPFFFFESSAGQFRIMTSDGAFGNFDGLCYDCSPFPRVVLRVDRNGFHDVGPQLAEQYDSEIALARAKIPEDAVRKFQQSDFKDARSVVLEIIFSYLYSGREDQAWQTLNEMWPSADRERIKSLITATRAKGILSKLNQSEARNIP